MRFELPEEHGLSASLQEHLLLRDEEGRPALSDVQSAALSAGVARGESLLVVSPTSTGKTQIALWAIANGLEQGCNTVYLVTHRALAKQKFEDFKVQLLQPYLAGNSASLVVATGDYVEDVDGEVPGDPLQAPLLVATYEKYLALLSAGGVPKDMLRDLHRNLVWTLQGVAAIATAACDKRVPRSSRPVSLHVEDAILAVLSKLPRAIRRLSFRVSEGLPDDAVWMTSLCPPGAPYRLSRSEILSLRASGHGNPQSLMIGTKDADAARVKAFEKTKPDPLAKANWVRDACRDWKRSQRARAAERQVKRAKKCPRVDLVERFYQSTGKDFEIMFEEVLTFLKIPFDKLDDKTKTGAPDYLLKVPDSEPLVVELKSKEEGKLVDYNKAVEVLAASEVHGHKETLCVTLCHPGVDPSVAAVIAACERLCVVESVDFGEALLRYCEGTMSNEQLFQWLATPGQATSADLPFRDYGV